MLSEYLESFSRSKHGRSTTGVASVTRLPNDGVLEKGPWPRARPDLIEIAGESARVGKFPTVRMAQRRAEIPFTCPRSRTDGNESVNICPSNRQSKGWGNSIIKCLSATRSCRRHRNSVVLGDKDSGLWLGHSVHQVTVYVVSFDLGLFSLKQRWRWVTPSGVMVVFHSLKSFHRVPKCSFFGLQRNYIAELQKTPPHAIIERGIVIRTSLNRVRPSQQLRLMKSSSSNARR
jgi:hypothetical protein